MNSTINDPAKQSSNTTSASANSSSNGTLAEGFVLPPSKVAKTSISTNEEKAPEEYKSDNEDNNNDLLNKEEAKTTEVTPIKGNLKFIQNNDHDSGNYLTRPLILADIKEEDK
jgi:hypothetical protein